MSDSAVVADKDEYKTAKKSPKQWHDYWTDEKSAADKRVRKFQKQGNSINNRYTGGRDAAMDGAGDRASKAMRLNLFHTNVATMQAMLYGSTPKIEVTREHSDPDDDIARVASMLFQRILEADTRPSGDDLGTTLRAALQDRLLPGLGIARVRYEVEMGKAKSVLNPATMELELQPTIEHEAAPLDYVHWQDFLWGWGRTWSEIPWLGYRSWLTKSQVAERFSKKVAEGLSYKEQMPTGGDKNNDTSDSDDKNNTEKAEIWEFWDKTTKQVFWWSDSAELILDSKDDPLGLRGFWPSPRPMMANTTTTLFMPKGDFTIAQDLYNEIDELQARIGIITRAVKVVGVYDKASAADLSSLLNDTVENDMVAVDSWAAFAEKGGLAGVIDWFPTADIVQVLQTLITIRDQTIELLYQITGMSDVLRGANTDQYTSDGTNQLKAKFGSIRVQALQDEFARFASDLDGLKAEVVAKHFDPQTIAKQSNAQFMPEADKDKIVPAMQLMKSPDIIWRVNIRPESIAMVDYAQLKQERSEFLIAMATYIQSAQAAAKAMPGALPVLLEMLKWGMAGFKGANELEGTMDAAIEMAKKAPPEGDDGAKDKAAQQAEMQKIQAKSQADMQLIQSKAQAESQKNMEDHQAKMELQQAKNMSEMQKTQANTDAALKLIMSKLGVDLQVEEAQSTMAMAEEQLSHSNAMVEEEQEHSNALEAGRQNRQNDGD